MLFGSTPAPRSVPLPAYASRSTMLPKGFAVLPLSVEPITPVPQAAFDLEPKTDD